MHGIICFLLAQHVENSHGAEFWADLHYSAGIAPRRYKPTGRYPTDEILALVQKLADATGRPVADVLTDIGIAFAPHLLTIYSTMIRPEESTLSLLSIAEDVVHRTVRLHNPEACPPFLKCMWRTTHEMELIYSSPHKLCPLAKGIIRGVANWFDETVEIKDTACMLKGDPYCGLSITVSGRSGTRTGARRSDSSRRRRGNDSSRATKPMTASEAVSYEWLPAPLVPGDLGALGYYRLLQALGEGGMGVVFLAHDTQLERRVAIKLLKPALIPDSKAVRDFLREARAAASLSSDYIVPIYQISEESGFPFMVMPVLAGQSLRQWLAQKTGNATLGRIVRIGLECARGLAAAHAQSLVHRDVKPSNIWLESPTGRVKLMDFGLARCRTHAECGSEFL